MSETARASVGAEPPEETREMAVQSLALRRITVLPRKPPITGAISTLSRQRQRMRRMQPLAASGAGDE